MILLFHLHIPYFSRPLLFLQPLMLNPPRRQCCVCWCCIKSWQGRCPGSRWRGFWYSCFFSKPISLRRLCLRTTWGVSWCILNCLQIGYQPLAIGLPYWIWPITWMNSGGALRLETIISHRLRSWGVSIFPTNIPYSMGSRLELLGVSKPSNSVTTLLVLYNRTTTFIDFKTQPLVYWPMVQSIWSIHCKLLLCNLHHVSGWGAPSSAGWCHSRAGVTQRGRVKSNQALEMDGWPYHIHPYLTRNIQRPWNPDVVFSFFCCVNPSKSVIDISFQGPRMTWSSAAL